MNLTERNERQGYVVTTVVGTGNIVITLVKGGFSKSFPSIREAYKFYKSMCLQ
jgi:hypothetical protein